MFYVLNFVIPIVLSLPILYLIKHQKKHKKLLGLLAIFLILYLLTLPFLNTSGLYFMPFKIVG